MQVVMFLGADTKEAAYTAFSRRANVLMLEGWELDPYGSSDTTFAVRRDRESRVLDVTECWDEACIAARPPSGLPEADPTRPVSLERLPDGQQPNATPPVTPPPASQPPTNGHVPTDGHLPATEPQPTPSSGQ